ncbi:MAG: coproporphyrinogen III oxidase [Chloroflexi bacterium HGW-Chloroflexi-6]|nr:MAG: coproporphyrinogen III oxidase [Chloroflexi bacterium HGW-Chloroflexi-6]
MIPSSLYLHIPFCVHRCAYCDFNTYAGQEALIPAYAEALIREIESVAARRPDATPAHSIFFGGGTPSLIATRHLSAIMDALRQAFTLTPDLEATLEANPGTVTAQSLAEMRAAGLNRLSFGVQSANPGELRMLERAHDFFDVIQSVQWAREAGFERLNLDLIYGLPEQSLESWQNSVKRITDLAPDHISMYALTLEHGTPFGRWAARGLLPIPDPDLAAEMYEWAEEYLTNIGYAQYEISNWALPGQESRHNLQYWRNLPYFGFGAGAHGSIDGIRYSNVLRIKTYIERLVPPSSSPAYPLSPATVNQNRPSQRDTMQETMMLGLRLVHEGVSDTVFRARFGIGIHDAFPHEVDELTRLGMLEWHNDALRLTPRARLIGNQVFMRFVGD